MADALSELWLPHDLLAEDDNCSNGGVAAVHEEEFIVKEDLYYFSLLHKQSSEVMAESPPSRLRDKESWVKPRFFPHAASNLLSSHFQTLPTQRVYARTESSGTFYPNPSLSQQRLRVAQFFHPKRQQMIPSWRSHSRDECGEAKGCLTHVGFTSSSDSPPLQLPPAYKQLQGYGMRAVFLNPRKESSGTGVFLPRKTGGSGEPREKPACSAALLPARVVQVLNMDLDDLGIHPRLPTHDSGLARNHKRSSNRPLPTSASIRLPPEWTY